MLSRTIIAATTLLAAGLCLTTAASTAAAAEQQPNFVFFLADDISDSDLGCYGHPSIKTPHIDTLAADGVRFTNAYLTTSSCSPSRCSLITGRYPHNTGAPELHTTLPTDQVCFPTILREHGYYTVLSGKNHMGNAVQKAFDKISPGKGPGKEGDWVEILQQRPTEKPFFCWFASTDAHCDWQMSDDVPTYSPQDVVIPPYLIDGLPNAPGPDWVLSRSKSFRSLHWAGRRRTETARCFREYGHYCDGGQRVDHFPAARRDSTIVASKRL